MGDFTVYTDTITDPWRDRMALFDMLAEESPEALRLWIERHPRNLQLYVGLECLPFHDDGFNLALRNNKCLWLAPRGSGKSTSLAVILATWLALSRTENRAPELRQLFPDAPRPVEPGNIRIALTSNSAPKAESLLGQVQAILNDERITKLFGQLEGKRWRDDSADTTFRDEYNGGAKPRERTFTALGLGTKITGGHYDVVICDDWVVLENSRTELQRSRIKDFWKFTIKGTLEPWARTVVCGTRYHPLDWYDDVIGWSKGEQGWAYLRTPALTMLPDGTEVSYWPSLFTLEKLYEIREEIGPIAFATQYQNVVDLMLGEFFSAEWLENFKRYDTWPEDMRRKARTAIALDPSIKGGEKNDFAGFVLVTRIGRDFHIRRAVRGHWTQHGLIEKSEELWKEYGPHVFPVEAVQGQEYLAQEMRRTTSIPVKSKLPKRVSKEGRAEKVRTYYETGRVYLEPPTPANGMQRLIEEHLAFPTGEHEDLVDAAVWAMLELGKSRGRVGNRRTRKRVGN